MVGLIVKVEEGSSNELAGSLSGRDHLSIRGVEDSQIMILLDTDDIHVIAKNSCEIQAMKGVLRVYPIFY